MGACEKSIIFGQALTVTKTVLYIKDTGKTGVFVSKLFY